MLTFREITNHVSAAVEPISHYLGSPPQWLKDSFAAFIMERTHYFDIEKKETYFKTVRFIHV